MEELKPCPFCGSPKVGVKVHETHMFSSVICTYCSAEGPPAAGEGSEVYAEAAEIWNRRQPAEDNQSWLREAVERVLASAPRMSEHDQRRLVEQVGLELARAHARARHEPRKPRPAAGPVPRPPPPWSKSGES